MQLFNVKVPTFVKPPLESRPSAILPLVIVKPEMVTVVLDSIENTLLVSSLLMLRLLAPVPLMVRFLLTIRSVPPREITPLTLKSIVPPGVAVSIASRREQSPSLQL